MYKSIKGKLTRHLLAAKCTAVGLSFHDQLGFYIKVDNGLISIVKLRNYEERNESVELLIRSALAEYGVKDLPWTFICTDDIPFNSPSAVSYRTCSVTAQEACYGMPDFLFHRWTSVGVPDFYSTAKELSALSLVPSEMNKVGWRGAATHPSRDILVAFKGELFDFSFVQPADYPGGGNSSQFITLDESIRRWSWLIDVEGRGYSGRVKLLLASGRPLILVDRPFVEWYMPEFVAGTHYLSVRRDLSDLSEKVEWLATHDAEARTMGRSAAELSQILFSKSSVLSQVYKSLYKGQYSQH
jgi:hypothetical protein